MSSEINSKEQSNNVVYLQRIQTIVLLGFLTRTVKTEFFCPPLSVVLCADVYFLDIHL